MAPLRPPAPADHFSSEQSRITDLSENLAGLRKALPVAHRLAGGAHHGMISALAAIIAYLPTQALGLREGFWSAITAIGVVQTEFHATQTTARDQFFGAAMGGVTATIIVLVPHAGPPWAMFESRIVEVGWGVSVAVGIVWLAARFPLRYLQRRRELNSRGR